MRFFQEVQENSGFLISINFFRYMWLQCSLSSNFTAAENAVFTDLEYFDFSPCFTDVEMFSKCSDAAQCGLNLNSAHKCCMPLCAASKQNTMSSNNIVHSTILINTYSYFTWVVMK